MRAPTGSRPGMRRRDTMLNRQVASGSPGLVDVVAGRRDIGAASPQWAWPSAYPARSDQPVASPPRLRTARWRPRGSPCRQLGLVPRLSPPPSPPPSPPKARHRRAPRPSARQLPTERRKLERRKPRPPRRRARPSQRRRSARAQRVRPSRVPPSRGRPSRRPSRVRPSRRRRRARPSRRQHRAPGRRAPRSQHGRPPSIATSPMVVVTLPPRRPLRCPPRVAPRRRATPQPRWAQMAQRALPRWRRPRETRR